MSGGVPPPEDNSMLLPDVTRCQYGLCGIPTTRICASCKQWICDQCVTYLIAPLCPYCFVLVLTSDRENSYFDDNVPPFVQFYNTGEIRECVRYDASFEGNGAYCVKSTDYDIACGLMPYEWYGHSLVYPYYPPLENLSDFQEIFTRGTNTTTTPDTTQPF